MNSSYIVRFIRSDDLPDEEYTYQSAKAALSQYKAQQHEHNDVYFAIQLLCVRNDVSTIQETAILSLSKEEKAIVLQEGCGEQLSTCLRLREILPSLTDDNSRRIAIMARIKIENLSPSKYAEFFTLLKEQMMA